MKNPIDIDDIERVNTRRRARGAEQRPQEVRIVPAPRMRGYHGSETKKCAFSFLSLIMSDCSFAQLTVCVLVVTGIALCVLRQWCESVVS
jgi:hypothetical protein